MQKRITAICFPVAFNSDGTEIEKFFWKHHFLFFKLHFYLSLPGGAQVKHSHQLTMKLTASRSLYVCDSYKWLDTLKKIWSYFEKRKKTNSCLHNLNNTIYLFYSLLGELCYLFVCICGGGGGKERESRSNLNEYCSTGKKKQKQKTTLV